MKQLFYKEIIGFFSTLTGYLVITVFLIVNGLLLWVIPGVYNIPEGGYATLKPFFEISPIVFLFLVSAVTMRMFAEEKKQGTLEILLTRPLSEMQIILSKYFAAVTLVIFSLIPTVLFYISVYYLGNPVGNIDSGGTLGSYLGLFFLASIYAAIGLFASSLTDNQVVAFILAIVLSLIMYIGFDVLSQLSLFIGLEHVIALIGINEHYKSISRGVIDTRDIVYYISIVALFLFFTRTVLQFRKW